MSTENGHSALRHFVKLLDKPRPLALQRFDDMTVMNDLVPHIDRFPVLLQGVLDDVDRPDHSGAKASRLGKDYPHGQ
jgi:hypothetical protein